MRSQILVGQLLRDVLLGFPHLTEVYCNNLARVPLALRSLGPEPLAFDGMSFGSMHGLGLCKMKQNFGEHDR